MFLRDWFLGDWSGLSLAAKLIWFGVCGVLVLLVVMVIVAATT